MSALTKLNVLGFFLFLHLTFAPTLILLPANRYVFLALWEDTFFKLRQSEMPIPIFYNSHLRSLLENGTIVWSPYTISNVQRLDRVQNRFLSFASYRLLILRTLLVTTGLLMNYSNSNHYPNVVTFPVVALFGDKLKDTSTPLIC